MHKIKSLVDYMFKDHKLIYNKMWATLIGLGDFMTMLCIGLLPLGQHENLRPTNLSEFLLYLKKLT